MADRFFFEQMVKIMHSPVWIYDEDGCLIEKIGSGDVRQRTCVLLEEGGLTALLTDRKHYPVLRIGKDETVILIIYSKGERKSYLFGPVMFCASSFQKDTSRGDHAAHMSPRSVFSYCPFDVFVSCALLLYWKLTGEKMTVPQLWQCNRVNFDKIRFIGKRMSEDMFFRQENYGSHNPCEQELRELESIEHGDEEALRQSISEIYEGTIGILAKTPLRHHKNVAIGNITLASRAAIRGGLSAENSFSMADSMIQQVEEIDNIPEVEIFKRECQFIYAAAVREERGRRGKLDMEGENPIVGKVKDYIFSHLHSKIKVADIARMLKMNPDYLSYVFHRSENITIKRYILEEKIRRSQNLLKYSNYQIKEIGFYLGFSSQSHFTRVFCETTGMKPNDYRKKYGNRENWSKGK